MLKGIYSAASALRTAEFQQNVTATNLAHMSVPGFRKSLMTVTTFDEELAAQQNQEPGYGSKIERLSVDFSTGAVLDTGRSLDVAIVGDGFFAVEGAQRTLYTRNGAFHVGEDGSIVNGEGMPLLGDGGPLSVPADISPGQIVISNSGAVSAGETQIGRIKLAVFEDNSQLKQVGTTLFSAESATVSDEEVRLRQGAREQSNVSPIDELVEMIVAMRFHEASQRTLKSIEDAIEKHTEMRG